MAIRSLDDYIAAVKQRLVYMKTGPRTMIPAQPFSVFDVAGNPCGKLTIGNTANGVVPVSGTPGYPVINTIAKDAYISRLEFGSSVPGRWYLYDRVFAAGAYPHNAKVTLTSQPSYAARLPGTNYKGLEVWVEAVSAFGGLEAVVVTYTNQDGTTGHNTDAVTVGAPPTLGQCWKLPLAAGDTGIQRIEGVMAGGIGKVGSFNVMVLRPLGMCRVRVANDGDVQDMLKTGLPQIYGTSALYMLVANDSTALGLPEFCIEVCDG